MVCSETFSSEAPPRERTSPRARTRARSAQVKGTPSSSRSVDGFRRNRIKSRPCCEGTSCKEDGRGRTARLLQSAMIASSTRPRGCARSGGGRARCLRRGPGIERRRGLVVGDGLRAYERLRVLMDAACGVHKVVSCVPLCGAPQMASTTSDAGRAVLLKVAALRGLLLSCSGA